jgi:hypothetical protein
MDSFPFERPLVTHLARPAAESRISCGIGDRIKAPQQIVAPIGKNLWIGSRAVDEVEPSFEGLVAVGRSVAGARPQGSSLRQKYRREQKTKGQFSGRHDSG